MRLRNETRKKSTKRMMAPSSLCSSNYFPPTRRQPYFSRDSGRRSLVENTSGLMKHYSSELSSKMRGHSETQSELFGDLQRYESESDSSAREEESRDSPGVVDPETSFGSSISPSALSNVNTNSFAAAAVETLLESDPFDIDRLLRKQEETLCKRRLLVGPSSSRKKRRWTGAKMLKSVGSGTVAERWRLYLSSLEDDFFTSPEARMEEEGRVSKGKTAYRGLTLTPENNYDIKHLFEIKFQAKHSLGQPTASFDQLRTASGQLARLFITTNKADPRDFYKRGKLYESIIDMRLTRALLRYFQIRGSASTVAVKSMHLRTLADQAQIYYTGKDESKKGLAMAVSEYLLSMAASQKTEARRFARERKSTKERLLRGAMFLPEDFKRCTDAAKVGLNGIMSSFRNLQSERGLRLAVQIIGEKQKLLQKWCVNLIGLLILTGGGQRPQVFSQLQLPLERAFPRLKLRAEKMQYFEMSTVIEKTRRALDMPNVVFPVSVLKFVEFHALHIRPIIARKCAVDETELEEKTLFIDTRSGEPLSSNQVSSSFRRFLCRIDEELVNVTPMALRGSFATMMLQTYRKGRIFKQKSEAEFLEFLGKAMNTSPQQLAETYAGNDMTDFEECAREFTSVLTELEDPKGLGENDGELSQSATEYVWG